MYESSAPALSVLIVADHPMVRGAIRAVPENTPSFTVAGEAASVAVAIARA